MERVTQYDINRKTVQDGLKRRVDRLDAYEHDMIAACHKNCASAKEQREKVQAAKFVQVQQAEERAAMVRAKIEAQYKEQEQEQKANRAFRMYCSCVILFLWLTTWTQLPMWAAITTGLGLAAILMCYLYRVFIPFDDPGGVS